MKELAEALGDAFTSKLPDGFETCDLASVVAGTNAPYVSVGGKCFGKSGDGDFSCSASSGKHRLCLCCESGPVWPPSQAPSLGDCAAAYAEMAERGKTQSFADDGCGAYRDSEADACEGAFVEASDGSGLRPCAVSSAGSCAYDDPVFCGGDWDAGSCSYADAGGKRGLLLTGDVTSSMLAPFATSDAFKAHWTYSYAQSLPEDHVTWCLENDVEFAPMIWGAYVNLDRDQTARCYFNATQPKVVSGEARVCDLEDVVDAVAVSVDDFADGGRPVRFLMGYNEPWGVDQSDLSPAEATQHWRDFVQPTAERHGLELVAPTARVSEIHWLSHFLQHCFAYDPSKGAAVHGGMPCTIDMITKWSATPE